MIKVLGIFKSSGGEGIFFEYSANRWWSRFDRVRDHKLFLGAAESPRAHEVSLAVFVDTSDTLDLEPSRTEVGFTETLGLSHQTGDSSKKVRRGGREACLSKINPSKGRVAWTRVD